LKAMILAAGAGERMRPLTDHTPKPLLEVAGVTMIGRHIARLAEAGVAEIVINVSHLARQIMDYCGDGSRWHVAITYSRESQGLETAGGIVKALPLLGEQPFMIVNADVWTDYPFASLVDRSWRLGKGAHLVFVDSPAQHSYGDYILDPAGLLHLRPEGAIGVTYTGLAVYTSAFFAGVSPGKRPLRPLLDQAIIEGRLTGEHYKGVWVDVGTPERLQALNEMVSHQAQ